MKYAGSCHCGAISFEFNSPEIVSGLTCNCSICRRKGAIMTAFTISAAELQIVDPTNALATYEFASGVAKHHFCRQCGIYPFHQTMRKVGHYRVNIGCIEGFDSSELVTEKFNGASL